VNDEQPAAIGDDMASDRVGEVRRSERGAISVEYVVLVVFVGLAFVGGALGLRTALTQTVGAQESTIETSPQFVAPPQGSGGPQPPTITPIPPGGTSVAFASGTSSPAQGNRWSATVQLNVSGASQITLRFTPNTNGSGSGTVNCTVVNGQCSVTITDFREPPGNNSTAAVVFTVTHVDGSPFANGPSLTVGAP
jgi:Flp pilus assembly pilin Flp